ncbi:Thioredoxin-like protein AAED1 [Vanrija pseudolonga]|uniref:Thioredoxin-like protein AAED1 n=1 Tax=Vanrija pseudolonga TaxID=143232 RepID=A0AAF1BU62_9TREE|nr:Thioredoxin-like protein AAED1 [Vanrija pseudolonga]
MTDTFSTPKASFPPSPVPDPPFGTTFLDPADARPTNPTPRAAAGFPVPSMWGAQTASSSRVTLRLVPPPPLPPASTSSASTSDSEPSPATPTQLPQRTASLRGKPRPLSGHGLPRQRPTSMHSEFSASGSTITWASNLADNSHLDAALPESPAVLNSPLDLGGLVPSPLAVPGPDSRPAPVRRASDPAWPTYTPLPPPPTIGHQSRKAALGRKLAPQVTESLEHLTGSHRNLAGLLPASASQLHVVPEDVPDRPLKSPLRTDFRPGPRVRTTPPRAARSQNSLGLHLEYSPDQLKNIQAMRRQSASSPESVSETLSPYAVRGHANIMSTPHLPNSERSNSLRRMFSARAISMNRKMSSGSSSSSGGEYIMTPTSVSQRSVYMQGVTSNPSLAAIDLETYAKPNVEQLLRASELPIVGEDGAVVRFGDVVARRRTVVVFVRHWHSSFCAQYVKALVAAMSPTLLAGAKARLVIIGHGSQSMIKGYKEHFNCPFAVYTDPTRQLHDVLGLLPRTVTTRAGKGDYLVQNAAKRCWDTLMRASRMRGVNSGDKHQLGAEFVFDGSLCLAYSHRMVGQSDHASIPELVAAVRSQAPITMVHGNASRSNIQLPLSYASTVEFSFPAPPAPSKAEFARWSQVQERRLARRRSKTAAAH